MNVFIQLWRKIRKFFVWITSSRENVESNLLIENAFNLIVDQAKAEKNKQKNKKLISTEEMIKSKSGKVDPLTDNILQDLSAKIEKHK